MITGIIVNKALTGIGLFQYSEKSMQECLNGQKHPKYKPQVCAKGVFV